MAAASHCCSARSGPAGVACYSGACEAPDDCWEVMLLEPGCVGSVGVSASARAEFWGVALSWVATTSQSATLLSTCVELSIFHFIKPSQ